jgi:N-acetylglucosamine-6-phosphate deacetylase
VTGVLGIRGTVITPMEEIADGLVTIENGKIIHVGRWTEDRIDRLQDFRGCYVAPGLVDIHVHGGGGHSAMDPEGIPGLSEFLARGGVTSYLPTTHSAPHERIMESAKAISGGVRRGVDGAIPLGVHMEGPYISPDMCGAQNPDHIRPPDISEIAEVYDASGKNLRVVTLAPEREGGLDAIRWLASRGVVPAAGHTEATHDEMVYAIDAGLSHASHLFNQMRGFHHREPGAAGAALTDDRVTVELVADGFHLHPAILRIASRIKGPAKTALVSDSIPATGLLEGEYDFGGRRITVSGGRSLLESGRLAGSTITLSDAVRNMIRLAGVSVREAVEMASTTPARIAGASGCKGRLAEGMDADITILDGNLSPVLTMVAGEIVHRRN